MTLRLILLASAVALGILAQAGASQASEASREGFEGKDLKKDIHPRFKVCRRPENTFRFSAARFRTGRQSLELSITPQPLFEKPPRVLFDLNPANCLQESNQRSYWSDDFERAELWEDKNRNPRFGEGEAMFYGFSMWIDATSAPKGDFNRLVLGQWKAGCSSTCDVSPFLAQRLTGGFYHITLDVDAEIKNGGPGGPKSCKVLLAFSADPPSQFESPLALDRPVMCESRLQWPENELKPVEKIAIKRERYLPKPFDRWTDLVFRVEGGKTDGVIQVWAGGELIATATGWVGHRVSAGQKQYFKFGPYRDTAGYGVKVYLDNLARGQSYEEVDPAKF